jgi:hypothetical protein
MSHFGEPYTEAYLSKEIDGTPVRLAPMCPTTAIWQEKQQEICDWLMNKIGVDAVYLDQIAAGEPRLCMNRSHGHRTGNGAWWYYGYYNLLQHLRRITPPDHGYTTEANAEPYMSIMDSFLTWYWVQDGEVPAYPAIYAGYVGMFGRCYSADPDHLRILAGQSLCFGEQIGWIAPTNYLNSPFKDYFRKVARARHAHTDTLANGRMLRPPVLTGDIPTLTAPCYLGDADVLVSPAVISGLWQRRTDVPGCCC